MNLAYTLSTMYKRVHPERRATSEESRRCDAPRRRTLATDTVHFLLLLLCLAR
jgi:hypothetical protein